MSCFNRKRSSVKCNKACLSLQPGYNNFSWASSKASNFLCHPSLHILASASRNIWSIFNVSQTKISTFSGTTLLEGISSRSIVSSVASCETPTDQVWFDNGWVSPCLQIVEVKAWTIHLFSILLLHIILGHLKKRKDTTDIFWTHCTSMLGPSAIKIIKTSFKSNSPFLRKLDPLSRYVI